MQYLYSLQRIANELDQKGYYKQADKIDRFIEKLAQAVPAAAPIGAAPVPPIAFDPAMANPAATPPPAEPAPALADMPPPAAPAAPTLDKAQIKKNADEKIARTTLLMFQKLQDMYEEVLPNFDYMGKHNTQVVQSSFNHLVSLFKAVMRDKTTEYDHSAVDDYVASLKKAKNELDRSAKMHPTAYKVKIDKFYLLGELEILVRKLERLYDKGKFAELNPVVRKARSVQEAFRNVIRQSSEAVANKDLIQVN